MGGRAFRRGAIAGGGANVRAGEYKPPVAEDEGREVPVPVVRKSAADDISPEAMASGRFDQRAAQYRSAGNDKGCMPLAAANFRSAERGLVCFLKPGDRIGEVTLQSIEIIHPLPSEVRHRFYNPDVDQPWECRNIDTTLRSKQKSILVLRVLVRKQRSVRTTSAKRILRKIPSHLLLAGIPAHLKAFMPEVSMSTPMRPPLTTATVQKSPDRYVRSASNLQPLCGSCNSWKGARTIDFRGRATS